MQLKARIANIDDIVSMSMYQGISIKAYLFFLCPKSTKGGTIYGSNI